MNYNHKLIQNIILVTISLAIIYHVVPHKHQINHQNQDD